MTRRAALLALAERPWIKWLSIKSAPQRSDGQNEFGRPVYLRISWSRRRASVSVGWWCCKYKCWRWAEDDGPNDMQPTHWAEIPMPSAALRALAAQEDGK